MNRVHSLRFVFQIMIFYYLVFELRLKAGD
jgi:hypothetical protein